jgi:outer membrane receptor protein involved in Fe transport
MKTGRSISSWADFLPFQCGMRLRESWRRKICLALAVLCVQSARSARADDPIALWPNPDELPGDIADLDLEDLLKTPLVESAARRKQSLDDAPATVTQFTGEEIISAGVTTMTDLLRRVPGLFVLERKAKFLEAAMRGNYRVLLLVDGRLVSAADNTAFWEGLPVHPGEIERIEILRGPGSIVFGSDGLSGVINIVTKRPLDHPSVEALVGTGLTVLPGQPDGGPARQMRGFGSGYSSWGVANHDQTLAAKLTLAAGRPPEWIDLPATAPRTHGDFAFHGALGLEWRPNGNTTLFADLRHGQNEVIQNITGIVAPFYESHVVNSLTINFHRLALLPNMNLMAIADAQRVDLVDNAIGPDRMTVIHTEPSLTTVHALAQIDASQWHGRNIVSLAGETSYTSLEQLLGERAGIKKIAAVLQNETVLLQAPRLVLNVGARTERVTVSMNNHPSMSYAQFSPRLSLSISPSSKHIFRALATNAYRTPDLFTTYMDVPYTGVYPDQYPSLLLIRANPAVTSEKVLSAEVGYRGHPWRWLRVDATAYLQQMRGRIDVLRSALPVSSENGPNDWQSGVEVGVNVIPRRGFGGYLSYGHTYSTHNSPGMYWGFPSEVVSVGANGSWASFTCNVDFHWFSSFDSVQLDVTDAAVMFNRYRSQPEPALNLRVGERILNGQAEVFLSARNVLAMVRDYNSLTVLPNTWAQPIGATFMLGVRLPTR